MATSNNLNTDSITTTWNGSSYDATVSLTVASGQDLLVVRLGGFSTDVAPVSIEWNGTGLTQAAWAQDGNSGACGIYYVASPDNGTLNLVVNTGGSARTYQMIVDEASSVSTTVGDIDSGGSYLANRTLTLTTVSDDIILDVLAVAQTATVGSGQTSQLLNTNSVSGSSETATTTSTTMDWTHSADWSSNAAVVLTDAAPSVTVTQTDDTPTDGVIQTINSTGLTGSYTAATIGGYSILSSLNNDVSTTASTYTLDISAISSELSMPRIGEAIDLAVTATGGSPTQSITIQPASGWAVVELAGTLDKSTGSLLANIDTDLTKTTAVTDLIYYETADSTSITATGVLTSDALTFEMVLIQGGSSTTTGTATPATIETADAQAPTLSLPTSASITATAATIGCTTNESGGTMYFHVTTNSSESAATIKASGSTSTVSSTGIITKEVTGLTASTNYYGHLVQVDSDTLDSNVVSTTQFTTLTPDTTAPVLTSPTGIKTGSTTGSGTVSTDDDEGTLYYLASENATETVGTVQAGSNQEVVATGSQAVTVTGLSAATTYYLHYVHTDLSANDSTRVSSTSFTTDAATGVPVASRQTWSGLTAYLYTQGYRGSSDDIIGNWLSDEGHTGTQMGKWNRYLGGLGYTGSLSDKMNKWRDDA